MSAVAATSLLPIRFGRYVLFDLVGRGGMAEIYLARQTLELGGSRLCIVKQILPALSGDPRFSEMLVHEAKLAARLSHSNVVQVFDLGRDGDRLYIAMEYVEGFDLNDLLGRCSRAKVPLPFELAIDVVRETLAGLDYAHRRTDDDGRPLGIVHRDVSPSNLLLSFDGGVKVCDFGIARANETMEGAPSSTRAVDEALHGKAGYMSPEHARGEAMDARADVFAAGIVLWELVAGRRMYKPNSPAGSLLEQARRAEIPELPSRGLPEEDALRAILARALAVPREDRYPSAAAMLHELEDYAVRARLRASQLELGEWMLTTFGEEIVARRRSRERAVAALERGAPLVALPVPADAPAPSERSGEAAAQGSASVSPLAVAAAVAAGAPAPANSNSPSGDARRSASRFALLLLAVAALVCVLGAMRLAIGLH